MRKLILLFTIFILAFSSNGQEKIKWVSFEEAIKLNKENPKPILVDIYTDWCGFCKKMDLETYSNKTITKYINDNFYAVKLDGEGKKAIDFKGYTFKFQKKGRRGFHELPATLMQGKLSYPTTVFMDKDAELLQPIPGFLQKEQFEKILVFFNTEAYKNKSWDAFVKDFKSNL